MKEYLEEQFKSIEDKQDAHQELLGQLITIGEETKTTMATKDDVSRLETQLDTMPTKDDIASIKSDVSRLEGIMMQILNRLPKAEG